MALKAAFYGAGPQAQPYLQALARRPDVAVVAFCDPDSRAAEQAAAGWGASLFPACPAMLAETRPDVLWICVEPHLQDDAVGQAIERRIPFFAEPPAAANAERARLQARTLAAADLVTTVGFSNRYADLAQEAREYLGTNPVPLALAWWLASYRQETVLSAETLLWNDGCRYIDVLRLYCGEVQTVHALTTKCGSDRGGLVVQLEFAGGSTGLLTCTTYARPEARREIELLGPGWSLTFNGDLNRLRLDERDKTTILYRLNDPAADHVTAFLAAVVAGNPQAVACSYQDAWRTLAICQAAAISAREGRTVTLAELDGSSL
jgi:predicted dehydrogenase